MYLDIAARGEEGAPARGSHSVTRERLRKSYQPQYKKRRKTSKKRRKEGKEGFQEEDTKNKFFERRKEMSCESCLGRMPETERQRMESE